MTNAERLEELTAINAPSWVSDFPTPKRLFGNQQNGDIFIFDPRFERTGEHSLGVVIITKMTRNHYERNPALQWKDETYGVCYAIGDTLSIQTAKFSILDSDNATVFDMAQIVWREYLAKGEAE